MKKLSTIIASLLAMATFSYADMCSDISKSFNQLIIQLSNDTNGALSVATDDAQIAAIRQSYQIQLTMLQAQKESALVSAGCMNNVPPSDPVTPPSDPVTPPSDPVTPPSDPVTPPSDPVTPPSDPVTPPSDTVTPPSDPVTPPSDPVTPPSDPVTPPSTPPNDEVDCNKKCGPEAKIILQNYYKELSCQNIRGGEKVALIKAKMDELGCRGGLNLGHIKHDRDDRGKCDAFKERIKKRCRTSHQHHHGCKK